MKIIILHDADARIEYLDVADHLIGSDIEEFLTRQGFSVNNITWLVTSADHIPVVYHKYDIDCKTGEATHTKREAELQDLTIHGQLQALQHQEPRRMPTATGISIVAWQWDLTCWRQKPPFRCNAS